MYELTISLMQLAVIFVLLLVLWGTGSKQRDLIKALDEREQLRLTLHRIKADIECTDPDDMPEQRRLANRVYAQVCKAVRA